MDNTDIPIDIHASKLLSWLQSRNHIKPDWQKSIASIREKICDALLDMPERQDIVQLLSGTVINYFHCERIVTILADTESDTKNIFGFYSSQRMKDWQAIIKAYKRDNVYLGEAATMLQRLINYEIPAIKKKIAKLETRFMEIESTNTDCDKRLTNLEKKRQQKLIEFDGVDDSNLRESLMRRSDNADSLFFKCLSDSKLIDEIKSACNHYQKMHYATSNSSDEVLRHLSILLDNGNVLSSTFALSTGVDLKEQSEYSVLKNPKTYRLINRDLLELITFLKLRLQMLNTEHPSDILLSKHSNIEDDISLPSISTWLEASQKLYDAINDNTARHLCDIATKAGYVEEIVEQFDQIKRQKERLTQQKKECDASLDEITHQMTQQRALLQSIVKNTQLLQQQIESDISKQYNNRPVNVMANYSILSL